MESDFTRFTIGIAGLGLIGGSLAKAFKKAGFSVVGCDISTSTVDAALNTETIDKGSVTPSVLQNADIVFIALYPGDTVELVLENLSLFKKNAIVVDCCGIKKFVCNALDNIEKQFYFIGGHPMAGTENSGFEASVDNLFDRASFILTPADDIPEEKMDQLKAVIKSAGFKDIVITDADHHDRIIAFTSQLPHVIACSYVKSPSCPGHKGYSAGSFRDVSRVAHINDKLWAELFISNREKLCKEIDILIENMKAIRDAAASGDRDKLSGLLKEAGKIKDSVS